MEDESAQVNQELVRQHYAAFERGDLDGLARGLDPQVVITVHDEHGKPAMEPVQGQDGARSFFEDIHAAVAETTVDIERLRADGNRVLAQINLGGTVKQTGVAGVIPAVHLFTVHDGLITEIRTHRPDWHDYGASDAT
jgi:ketosteroid isomerase-like protein